MRKMGSLELNAIIGTMLDETSPEVARIQAAQAIVEYGHQLKSSSKVELSFKRSHNDDDRPSVTGHTTQLGEVTIKQSPGSLEPWTSISKERIGHYRIWKAGKGEIRFQHFKTVDHTSLFGVTGYPSGSYTLTYDSKTLSFNSLWVTEQAIEGREFWFLFWFRIYPRFHRCLLGQGNGTCKKSGPSVFFFWRY